MPLKELLSDNAGGQIRGRLSAKSVREKSGKIYFQVLHGLDNVLDRLVHTLSAGTYARCLFLLDPALNLGFDSFQVLSMSFKLQAMLFFHMVDDIGIDLLDKFIGLGH